MGILVAGSAINTVRVPELSPLTEDLPLALEDQIPVYVASENKLKKVPLSELNTFFGTGGGSGGHPPAAYGARYIYKVPASAAEGTIASLPTFAGLDFHLKRGGFPLIPLLPDESNVDEAEYEILDAGGFQLLQEGDVLNLGERFELEFFSLIGSTPGTGTGTTTGSFVGGKKLVTTNTTLDPNADINKVIQVRSASDAITITIPDVGDIPLNSLILIETSINNSKPTTLLTTGGQYIYLNTLSKNTLYMHPGEVCWLFRDDDGLYVINDFYRHYRDLCKPQASYEIAFDEVLCKGQLLSRADYPRIWEKAANLGFSLVSEATWNTASATVAGRTVPFPNRGCFSTGDGSTTFRMPDLMNMALRGLKTETGSDTERFLNKPGGYQRHELESHQHKIWGQDNTAPASGNSSPEVANIENAPVSGTATPPAYFSRNGGLYGGIESRMDNVGVYWVMKK